MSFFFPLATPKLKKRANGNIDKSDILPCFSPSLSSSFSLPLLTVRLSSTRSASSPKSEAKLPAGLAIEGSLCSSSSSSSSSRSRDESSSASAVAGPLRCCCSEEGGSTAGVPALGAALPATVGPVTESGVGGRGRRREGGSRAAAAAAAASVDGVEQRCCSPRPNVGIVAAVSRPFGSQFGSCWVGESRGYLCSGG